MNRQFTIQSGQAVNQEEVIRSLREKGYYSSGIPRPSDREAKKRAVPFRPLSSKQMRHLSPEDLQAYIGHAKREEGNNPHG